MIRGGVAFERPPRFFVGNFGESLTVTGWIVLILKAIRRNLCQTNWLCCFRHASNLRHGK